MFVDGLLQAFWTNFFPTIQLLRDILKASSTGDPRILTVNFGLDIISVERLNQKSLGGGGMLDLGCYCVMMSRMVFPDAELEKIVASGILTDSGELYN